MSEQEHEHREHRGGEHEETERTRREVVHLLRSILREATIQAHGPVPVVTPDMQAVIDLYKQIESQIELLSCSPIIV